MTLTDRDIRAIQLAQNFNKPLKDHLKEYHKLIETLIYLNEALKEANTQIKYWQKYSETLLLKICLHGFTIHKIYSGLTLESTYYPNEVNGKVIIDKASAKVILRSQLEAFLMYRNIYVNPKNDDEKELRFNAWIYASLYQRQGYPSSTEFAKMQKQKDQIEMEEIKTLIQNLKSYKKLNDKQKKVLLGTGTHKFFNHWSKILKDSGYEENHVFSTNYAHWSSYSHSEGVSAIQLHSTNLLYREDDRQGISDIQTSKLIICNLIQILKNEFKAVEIKYNTLPQMIQFDIEFYCELSTKAHY